MYNLPSPNQQPDFENLKCTLLNQKTNSVPLIELGIDPYIKSLILNRPCLTLQDDVEFMQRMGYDFVKLQPLINMEIGLQMSSKSGTKNKSIFSDDRAWAPESSGIIKNWADFENYLWPEPSDIDYSLFEAIKQILPDGMGVIGQYGDIFTLVWEMMGFENFAIAIYEQPDLVSALFDNISKLILSMFDTMSDMEWIGALWYSDDIAYSSGLMVHPDILKQYFFPYLAHIGKLTKKRGIPFIYHSDGVLWNVMDEIIGCGVNALHPIEPKSMDIVEVKKKVGKKLCICGGIEVDLLARASEDDIIKIVRHVLKEIAIDGGYCAGSSNSIPEYINVKNYLAMVRTVIEGR